MSPGRLRANNSTDTGVLGHRNSVLQLQLETFFAENLDVAKAAYIAARPHYEEIEVLYAGFPEIDSDLDARPYGFSSGDASCGASDPYARGELFQGYHKIEALIFRHASRSKGATSLNTSGLFCQQCSS